MRGVDALAVREAIHVFSVARCCLRKFSHTQEGSGTVVQSLATFLCAVVLLGQSIEDEITVLVDLTEKVRTSDAEHGFGHARVLRVVVDQYLPVIASFSKSANAQINRSAAHVFGRRELPELSLCIAIGRITAAHGGKSSLAG